MNVLLLSPWFPSPPFGGALIRVHETVRYVSGRHRVTLVAPVAAPPAAEDLAPLADLCEAVVTVPVSDAKGAVLSRLGRGLLRGRPFIQGLHYDAAVARHVARLTARHDYDVIHVEHSFMAPYLSSVSPRSHAGTVLSMHNVESLRFRRELGTARGARRIALLTDSRIFGSWETRAVRRFDGVVTVSGVEEAWVREHAPDVAVVRAPNGVDTTSFTPAEPPAAPRTFVFSGLMNYPPNVDAVTWFSDTVLPLVLARHPDARFRIVGDKPTPEVVALGRRPAVEVTGRVPDVRPHLASSAAMVVPLRSGAGTRLKILEAMAMRRPVVSTSQGAEGLDVTSGVNILLGDTPRALADHLCGVLDRPDAHEALAAAGRRLVETQYDWRTCLGDLDGLYRTVTEPGRSAVLTPARGHSG
jgi:sugar transferase (PEP-CTERM/EpsH1 system associated)